MITSLIYLLALIGLIAGVVWMVGHTLAILFAADEADMTPARRHDDPVTC